MTEKEKLEAKLNARKDQAGWAKNVKQIQERLEQLKNGG